LHASETSGIGNRNPKERSFADTEQEALELDRVNCAGQILSGSNVQHADGDNKAAVMLIKSAKRKEKASPE